MSEPPFSRRQWLWSLRHSLVAKAVMLFTAVSGLLMAEVTLGRQLGAKMERAADELAAIDRRGQSLLLSAGKINDMLYDLTVVEFSPQAASPAMLAHLHSHIVALSPIEMEIRAAGREISGFTVGELLARSSQVQMSSSATDAMLFAHEPPRATSSGPS
jgi:hypothetical protein